MTATILQFDPAKRRPARSEQNKPCPVGFGWLNPWLDAVQLWQGVWLEHSRVAAQAWLDVTAPGPARSGPAPIRTLRND